MLGKPATSSVLDGYDFMKKMSCSALGVVSPAPQGLALPEASSVCCLHSAIVSWPFYPSGQPSAEALFACGGQCLMPGLNVVSFNCVCSGLLVK